MAEEKKKKTGLIAAICAVVVIAIAAVVTVLVINLNKNNIVGTYKVSAILDSDGNETSDGSLGMMKAFGMDYAVEFKGDNTGVFKIIVNGEMMSGLVNSIASAFTDDDTNTGDVASNIPKETAIDFTYDSKKIKFSTPVTGLASTEADYEVKDGAIIINLESQRLKFTKQ